MTLRAGRMTCAWARWPGDRGVHRLRPQGHAPARGSLAPDLSGGQPPQGAGRTRRGIRGPDPAHATARGDRGGPGNLAADRRDRTLGDQLARIGDNIGDFEKTRPYILSTILEASRRLAPHSELTLSLAEDLLAARRPYGDVLLWPEKVEPMLISPDPSIAHTARAVRALAQVQAVRPTTQIQDALDQAAAWLVGRTSGTSARSSTGRWKQG